MEAALDRAISGALREHLDRKRARLCNLAIIAEQNPDTSWPRFAWTARVMTRDEFCAFIDGRARVAKDDKDRDICKDLAAWARGSTECVWIAVWADGRMHRGTLTRQKRGRRA